MTNGEAYMIKTYLVPTTYEMVEAMEKGEAPSFLHCATCLDGLTNGEVMQTLFNMSLDDFQHTWGGGDYTNDWWNRKWGE